MNMTEVVEMLRKLHVQGEPGPLGVTFSWYFDNGCSHKNGTYHFRVESGSGIAGPGDAWNVTELPDGPTLGPKVRGGRALRRQVLAAIAEARRPPDRDGYETYARWHNTSRGAAWSSASSVQWFQRRRRRPMRMGRKPKLTHNSNRHNARTK